MIKSIGKKFADAFLLLHDFIPYHYFYPASDAVQPFHPFYLRFNISVIQFFYKICHYVILHYRFEFVQSIILADYKNLPKKKGGTSLRRASLWRSFFMLRFCGKYPACGGKNRSDPAARTPPGDSPSTGDRSFRPSAPWSGAYDWCSRRQPPDAAA